MKYGFQRDKTGKLVPMDETVFRQTAAAEGIELPNDDSTQGYIRAILVSKSIDEKLAKARRREHRNFALKMLAIVVPLSGVGTAGYTVYAPDRAAEAAETTAEEADAASRRSMRNSLQIKKLGGEIVKVKEDIGDVKASQVAMPDYIIDSIRAKDPSTVEKPPVLQANDKKVKADRDAAAAAGILEVSDEELDAALEAEEQQAIRE